MKKAIRIKLSYLFAILILFVVYYFWLAHHHNKLFSDKEQDIQNPFSDKSIPCKYKNGSHPATIEYYHPQTKAEHLFHAEIELEECNVVKIRFSEKNSAQQTIQLPAALESDERVTVEDDSEGIYSIRVED